MYGFSRNISYCLHAKCSKSRLQEIVGHLITITLTCLWCLFTASVNMVGTLAPVVTLVFAHSIGEFFFRRTDGKNKTKIGNYCFV